MHFIVNLFRSFLRLLIFVSVLLVMARQSGYAQYHLRVESLPQAVKQGEACLIRALGPGSLQPIYMEFQGVRFPMAPGEPSGTCEGLIGVDMDTRPGTYEIKIVGTEGGRSISLGGFSLKVEKATFGIQRLSLPSSMVDLDAKTLERVNKEAKQVTVLLKAFRNERLWRGTFIRPVEGKLTGPFGVGRVINGQPRSPHSGVDLEAEEGTPVLACNSGMVVLVDHHFFSGKSVILDHGWGIYSMYFHLSETLVKEGDRVSKRATVGRVGSTGRSTNPHLHWGIRINGARVDPLSLPGVTKTAESGLGGKQK